MNNSKVKKIKVINNKSGLSGKKQSSTIKKKNNKKP